MTDDSKSGPKSGEEVDPLSATAMFFRALDKQSEASPAESPANFDFVAPKKAAGGQDAPPVGPQSGGGKGEFTAIFGNDSPAPPAPVRSTPQGSAQGRPSTSEPPWSKSDAAAKQDSGEFTRVFVKGASASPTPLAKISEATPEALPSIPARAKGFSSPGVSDSASAEPGFSQFFKPASKVSAAPAQPSQPPSVAPFRPETPRPCGSSEPSRAENPFGRLGDEPISSGHDPQSITNLIQSLSSPAASSGEPRASESAPYRSESLPSYQPVAKPATSSEFEAGGVTQFIQRLAEMPPAPAVEVPAAAPVRDANSGPGEYTRIISVPTRTVTGTPAPPAAPPAPASANPAFVRPAVPAMPVVPVAPPASAMAPQHAPLPAIPPLAIPAPHRPPMPAPPAVAAPKGKLEALVPMLLVVNTFLLVVILVVMIFLIKSR
jgi:hypothetical protein